MLPFKINKRVFFVFKENIQKTIISIETWMPVLTRKANTRLAYPSCTLTVEA
jgi:hypothetical protein